MDPIPPPKSPWTSIRGADWSCVDYMLVSMQRSFRRGGDPRKTVSFRLVRNFRETSRLHVVE